MRKVVASVTIPFLLALDAECFQTTVPLLTSFTRSYHVPVEKACGFVPCVKCSNRYSIGKRYASNDHDNNESKGNNEKSDFVNKFRSSALGAARQKEDLEDNQVSTSGMEREGTKNPLNEFFETLLDDGDDVSASLSPHNPMN